MKESWADLVRIPTTEQMEKPEERILLANGLPHEA
jgi:hypothetical protein